MKYLPSSPGSRQEGFLCAPAMALAEDRIHEGKTWQKRGNRIITKELNDLQYMPAERKFNYGLKILSMKC
jgi:hypothetical protein